MVNYSNGKVYKIEPIVNHDEGDIYIGSTTKQYLSQRMDRHRSVYKRWKQDNSKSAFVRSYMLFDKYGIENCIIVLLENVYANTKDELQAREKYYILNNKCVNKCIPLKVKEAGGKIPYNKLYKLENKEAIKITTKLYRDKNRESILKKKKEFRIANIEKVIEYKNWYNQQKIKCDICNGFEVTRCNYKRHTKSSRHQKHLNNNYIYEYFYNDGTPCSEEEYYLYNN